MSKLPKKKVKASRKSPKNMIIYGAPKIGKTTVLSQLDDCLIIDLEQGSDMLDALKVQVNSLKELENSLVKLNSTLKANTTKGNNTTNIEGNIETVKQEQSRLLKENETIIEAEEKKVSNLSTQNQGNEHKTGRIS